MKARGVPFAMKEAVQAEIGRMEKGNILKSVPYSEWAQGQSYLMFDQTSERPIAYASRTLNKNGLNYSQIDKEGASIIFALEKFSQYLLGNHFILTTDNRAIKKNI